MAELLAVLTTGDNRGGVTRATIVLATRATLMRTVVGAVARVDYTRKTSVSEFNVDLGDTNMRK